MKDIRLTIAEALGKQLSQSNYDVVDIVPIPAHGDRMLKLRTLEEILEEFESAESSGMVGYVLQIKPKRTSSAAAAAPEPPTAPAVYLPNGKLNVPFLIKNGDLLFEAGDFVLAKNIYRTILTSGEFTGPALFRIGKCLEAEGKLEEAGKHYEQSITYLPSLDAYQRLGAILISQKKDLLAAETLERALNLKDVLPQMRFEIHKACGNCYTRAQKPEEAERHFTAALGIRPTSDEIRANLGALHLQTGRVAEAKREFLEAVTGNPNSDKALTGLGSCAIAEGDKKAAHDYFARSLEIELNNPTAIYHLVKCAYEIKSYATAARKLGDYVEIAPINANLLYSLAGLQFHLGRLDDAGTTSHRILELQPDHAGAKDLLKLIERFNGTSG